MKYIITLLFFFSALCSYSQENPLEETIKKEINYKRDDYHDFEVKVLPNNPSLAIACATKYNGEVDEVGFNCDLILLLIDTKTEKIISRYIQENEYISDSYELNEVGLDMANYKVSDNLRAFGVRSHFSASSRVSPSSDTGISLFIIKNNKITRILDKFEISRFSGDWDTNCSYDLEEVTSILIMQKEKTNGFFNIQVKSTKTLKKSTAPKNPDDKCIQTEKTLKPTVQTLEYVNNTYKLRKIPAKKTNKK